MSPEEEDDDDDDVEVEGGEDTTEEQDFFPGEPRSFIDTAAAPTSSSSSFSSNPSYAVTVDDFPDPHLPFYAPPKLLSHPMIMGQVHVNYNTQFNGTCSQVRRIPISSSSSSLPPPTLPFNERATASSRSSTRGGPRLASGIIDNGNTNCLCSSVAAIA